MCSINCFYYTLHISYRKWIKCSLPAVIIMAIFLTGCSRPQHTSKTVTKSAGDINVSMTVIPWPPHSGDDTVVVTLQDSVSGTPIDNANIVATAVMTSPKLPGSNITGRFRGQGSYEIPVRLVATTYDLNIRIERPQKSPVQTSFPLEAWQ